MEKEFKFVAYADLLGAEIEVRYNYEEYCAGDMTTPPTGGCIEDYEFYHKDVNVTGVLNATDLHHDILSYVDNNHDDYECRCTVKSGLVEGRLYRVRNDHWLEGCYAVVSCEDPYTKTFSFEGSFVGVCFDYWEEL